MKSKIHIGLSMLMLLSAPVVAADNAEQGAAKPPAELRLLNSSNLSGSLSSNTGVQPAMVNVVDKVDEYKSQTDQAATQK